MCQQGSLMLPRCSCRARSKVGKPLACRSAVYIALEPFVGEFVCVLSLVHGVDSFAKLRVRFAQPNSCTFPTALTICIRVRPARIILPCERFRGAGKEALLTPPRKHLRGKPQGCLPSPWRWRRVSRQKPRGRRPQAQSAAHGPNLREASPAFLHKNASDKRCPRQVSRCNREVGQGGAWA